MYHCGTSVEKVFWIDQVKGWGKDSFYLDEEEHGKETGFVWRYCRNVTKCRNIKRIPYNLETLVFGHKKNKRAGLDSVHITFSVT